jgi:hypothetical protein
MSKPKIEWKGAVRELPKYSIQNYRSDAKIPDWLTDLDAVVILSTERPSCLYASFEVVDSLDAETLNDWVSQRELIAYGFTLIENEISTVAVLLGFLEEPTNTDASKLSSRCLEVAKWYSRYLKVKEN